MRYALIWDGIILNVIWLDPANAMDFPSAVPIGDVDAGIGDTYADGAFWRNGLRLLTPLEAAEATIEALTTQACTLAEQVIDLTIALAEAGVSV